MINYVIDAVGTVDSLYTGLTGVATCGLSVNGPLKMSAFLEWTAADLNPEEMQLGLVTLNRSICLALRVGNIYMQMPYLHDPAQTVPTVERGLGIWSIVSLCDESGICQTMRVRSLSHRFTSMFFDAVREQIASGLTWPQHDDNIQAMYAIHPRKLFRDALVTDRGWS